MMAVLEPLYTTCHKTYNRDNPYPGSLLPLTAIFLKIKISLGTLGSKSVLILISKCMFVYGIALLKIFEVFYIGLISPSFSISLRFSGFFFVCLGSFVCLVWGFVFVGLFLFLFFFSFCFNFPIPWNCNRVLIIRTSVQCILILCGQRSPVGG